MFFPGRSTPGRKLPTHGSAPRKLLSSLTSWVRRSTCSRSSLRVEPLEDRNLLSVVPALAQPPVPVQDVGASSIGSFHGDSETQTALLDFAFDDSPVLENTEYGTVVSLGGEQTWLATGDPLVPVRESTILLPQGMEIMSVEVSYGDAGRVIGSGVQLLAAPAAIPLDGSVTFDESSITTVSTSFPDQAAVTYSNHTLSGYNLGTLRVFPVQYDAITDKLTYHSSISVGVTVGSTTGDGAGGSELGIRNSAADRDRVAQLIDNPEALGGYEHTPPPADASSLPPTVNPLPGGSLEYVVITSSALADSFQPLIASKTARGLSAGIVTTETIYASYSGTETGDYADRIRHFITTAYAFWGTQWVLLGGDVEVVPQRGVYVSQGSTVDYDLPTDMYFACLDGTWNGDGDGTWGERYDGAGGGDVDLVPEVYLGRAPVSNATEAQNFVAKTVQYETTAHSNATTAVWLGEQLDSRTWGSYSSIPIRDRAIPDDWNLVERYDSSATWSGNQFRDDLNAGPHLVNHLGHANSTYNARLANYKVAGLANDDPYFMYSQGCYSGSFDTHDLAIAENHVVDDHGAFGVVMNSRYGWYMPGSTPAASHYYAMEFWDAVFNEDKLHLGEANQDSRDDNLFRVGGTGVYRWIHLEVNLLGDPETPLQIGDFQPPPEGDPGHLPGLYDPGQSEFLQRHSIGAGPTDRDFVYGVADAGWVPLAGDWNGDGTDTVGLYAPDSSTFFLNNVNATRNADVVFSYGPGGLGWIPIVGDFNGDGVDTVGLYAPDSSTFFLNNANTTRNADVVFSYGPGGLGWMPIVGDWNGDGVDTVGLYAPDSSTFFLNNANTTCPADTVFGYGPAGFGWEPLVGDWDADDTDTVGLYAPDSSTFFLNNANTTRNADSTFAYGSGGQGFSALCGAWTASGGSPLQADESADHGDRLGLAAEAVDDLASNGGALADRPGPLLKPSDLDTIYRDGDPLSQPATADGRWQAIVSEQGAAGRGRDDTGRPKVSSDALGRLLEMDLLDASLDALAGELLPADGPGVAELDELFGRL